MPVHRDDAGTVLGAFARRELESFTRTARAGARRQLENLAAAAQAALKDLERGGAPSADLGAIARSADYWTSQLMVLQEVHSVLQADQKRGVLEADHEPQGLHKVKVRITGLGKAKILTYQTARTVAMNEEVEVPRWPGMPAGPPLRGTIVALTSDHDGPLVTLIGG